MRRATAFAALLGGLLAAACGGDVGPEPPPPGGVFHWDLPAGFPTPKVPDDNPMTAAKVDLGRHLFYDRRLSVTGEFACASCHEQQRAFTDGRALAVGATGDVHPRNSMSLANVAYGSVLTWGNPNIRTLEQQALQPMFGQHPIELGLAGREPQLFATLRGDPTYQRLFPAAFPDSADPVTLGNVTKALAVFQRIVISGDAPYDRYLRRGQSGAISAAAKRGETLFFGEQVDCFHCHGDFNFTTSTVYVGKAFTEREFFNNGLYNIGGTGDYPLDNIGVKEFTGAAADMGRFKAPTLRNIAVTAPYMHDGSIPTLDQVLDHYAAGGRTIVSGPRAGVGSANPYKSELVDGFTLSDAQRADLLAFLRSLTDSTFLTDPRFSNPWPAGGPGGP